MKRLDFLIAQIYSVGNIKVKVMGIVLATALVLGGIVIQQARSSLVSQATDQLGRQAISLAHFVAARGTDLVLTNNLYGLRELLHDTMVHNPDLRYVVIYDPDGKVVDSTFGRQFPYDLLRVATAPGTVQPAVLDAGEERIYDVAVPMFDGRAGIARIGVTDSRIMITIWTTVRRMLAETAAITAAALLAALALTVLLTRPLEELVAATRAVGSGNLRRRPRVYGTDEIGHLSSSFNTMIDSLQASREELLQRNRHLTVLNRVAESVSRPLGDGDALQAIMTDVQSTLGLERVCIFRLDRQETGQPSYCSKTGMPPACFGSPEARQSVAAMGEPLLSDDGGTVPLVAEGRVVGVLCFHGASGAGTFKEPGLWAALSRQIGIALENLRLLEELRAKEAVRAELVNQLISAQEAERKRIALELHDQTGQLMTSIMVGLKLLEGATSPEQTRARIMDLKSIAATVLEEIHSLALELRPPVLDDLGLVHALDRYTRDFSRKTRIRVQMQADGFFGRHLPQYVGTTLYRIVQEALTNVARHSGAHHVNLALSWQKDRVTGVIHDDGRGFDMQEVQSRQRERLGLFSMQERAKLVGGRLQIHSSPGSGTTVLVQVPAPDLAATEGGIA